MPRPKDEKKLNDIYIALLRSVLQTGLAGVTIASVAKEAGIGTGTMYVYFKSKEELINQLYRKIRRESGKNMAQVLEPGNPFVQNFRKIWEAYLENRTEHYAEEFFIEQCKRSHFLDEQSQEVSTDSRKVFEDVLDEGKRQMLLKDIPSPLMLAHLSGSANELAEYIRQHPQEEQEPLKDTAFSLYWDSVKR